MHHALAEFRKAAARKNRDRDGLRRRYSPALQERAVEYWRRRQCAGDGVPVVAAALGAALPPPVRVTHPASVPVVFTCTGRRFAFK